jgi:hypothetical protein
MKLADNETLIIKAEIQIKQKDIDFLFNGWNYMVGGDPDINRIIVRAIEHLNNTRAVEVKQDWDADMITEIREEIS